MQSCDYPTVRRLIDDGERTLTVCSDLTFTNATADKTICTVSSDDGTEDWVMASERKQSGGLL